MPKHRGGGGRRRRVKLKKETIDTLFALAAFVAGLLQFLSFSKQGDALIALALFLDRNFGQMQYGFPLVFIFLAFLFFRFKFFLSKPHVAIGYGLTFFSTVGVLRSGSVGMH